METNMLTEANPPHGVPDAMVRVKIKFTYDLGSTITKTRNENQRCAGASGFNQC